MMKYLICYDIANPKRLARISKVLNKNGFRTQKSFFSCDLTEKELNTLKNEILPFFDNKKDKLAIYTFCDKCYKDGVYIGCDMRAIFFENYWIL